jgi:arylsulfatase A-like enzyme
MKHKHLILIIIVGLSTLVSFQKVEKTTKPNIVYILTDQWRASALGYAGDPNVKTPNLDKFSEQAVNFTNAVSVLPVCTPHRASLLTGRYPTSTGMFLNDLYLPSEELCMAEIFKAEGYNTAYLGKWHLDGHGRENNVAPERRQGFDYWKALECSHNYNKMPYYDNENPEKKFWEGYSPYALATDANQYLTVHAKDEKPFLLFISIATPHFPHNSAPQKYKDMYPMESLKLLPNVPVEWEAKPAKNYKDIMAIAPPPMKPSGMF